MFTLRFHLKTCLLNLNKLKITAQLYNIASRFLKGAFTFWVVKEWLTVFFEDVYLPFSHSYRFSLPKAFCKQGALKNFAKFTGKWLCWSLFLIKVLEWGPATLLKKRLTCEFCEIVKNTFLHRWTPVPALVTSISKHI